MVGPSQSATHRVDISDAATAATRLSALYGEVRVSVEGPFQWRAAITALGHVTVVQGSVSAPVVLDVRAGSYVIHLSRGGVAVVAAGGASVPVAAGQSGALASPGRRLRWASSSAFQGLTVRIAPAYLRSQLAALTGEEPRSDPEIALALAGGGAPAGVIERFCRSSPASLSMLAASRTRAWRTACKRPSCARCSSPSPTTTATC
ncbi:MAG: hypothetical protein R3F14_04645 [Polyangiaceae bacterium]